MFFSTKFLNCRFFGYDIKNDLEYHIPDASSEYDGSRKFARIVLNIHIWNVKSWITTDSLNISKGIILDKILYQIKY